MNIYRLSTTEDVFGSTTAITKNQKDVIVFDFLEPRYESKDKMICNDGKSYTTYTASKSCNGWAGISLDECKQKCTNNEVPNDSCPGKGGQCKFVQYYPNTKWCHLADASCVPIMKGKWTSADPVHVLYQKG